jgi:hypothetical protein
MNPVFKDAYYPLAFSQAETNRIINNRNNFADTHRILKHMSLSQASRDIRKLVLDQKSKNSRVYDHIEIYKTVSGDAMLTVSPYGKMSPEELANDRLFGTQFIETDDLYGNGTTTYYKIFQYRRYPKKEIMKWTA